MIIDYEDEDKIIYTNVTDAAFEDAVRTESRLWLCFKGTRMERRVGDECMNVYLVGLEGLNQEELLISYNKTEQEMTIY